MDNIHNDSSFKTNQITQQLREKQQIGVATQTSPPDGIRPQKPVTATEQSHESQSGNEPIQFLSCSNSCPTEIQQKRKPHMDYPYRRYQHSPLTITTPTLRKDWREMN